MIRRSGKHAVHGDTTNAQTLHSVLVAREAMSGKTRTPPHTPGTGASASTSPAGGAGSAAKVQATSTVVEKPAESSDAAHAESNAFVSRPVDPGPIIPSTLTDFAHRFRDMAAVSEAHVILLQAAADLCQQKEMEIDEQYKALDCAWKSIESLQKAADEISKAKDGLRQVMHTRTTKPTMWQRVKGLFGRKRDMKRMVKAGDTRL